MYLKKVLVAFFIILTFKGFGIVHKANTPALTKINGTVAGQNEVPLLQAQVYVVDIENSLASLGAQPGDSQLQKIGKKIPVNAEGSFTGMIDASVPHYIYFTGYDKKTTGTFFPAGKKTSVQIKATLFDNDFVRDEREVVINTDDSEINSYIKAYTLSTMSANTDVKLQMDSSINYTIKHGTKEGFTYDLSNYYNSMLSIYNAAATRELKNYVLLNLAFLCVGNKYPVEEKYLLEAVKYTPASDLTWFAESGIFVRGCYFGLGTFKKHKDVLLPLMEGLVDDCPVESLKPLELFSLLYYADTDGLPEAQNYYARLINNYPQSPQAALALKRFSKNLKVTAGKTLPPFSLANADKPGSFITNETANGKIRLIDFWATWCGPCVGQLSYLESAYKKYSGKGLEIISISFDRGIADIGNFRSKRYPMPWINAYAGLTNTPLRDSFEIFGIPKLVLVDKNNVIITANQQQLDGPNLDATLQKYIK